MRACHALLAPGCTNDGKIQPKPRRDAIEMTRRGRVFEKIVVLRAIHSSDSSNGDASRTQIHECDDTARRAKLGSITKRRGYTPARRRLLGTSLIAIRAAAPKFRAMAPAR